MAGRPEWFVKRDGGAIEKGPFSSSELNEFARTGRLSPVHMVRQSHREEWRHAIKIKGLEFNVALDAMSSTWGELEWSNWMKLEAPLSDYQINVTKEPGFYRVRSSSCPGLVYVGQTGRDLRARTRSLARWAYSSLNEPPWNDPHTAASILWAYQHEDGFQYEVSVTSKHCDKPERQCHEDYLLYLHRVQFGHTTLANLGRLHGWWTRPTNKRDGRPMNRRESPEKYPSLPPAVGNINTLAPDWIGLEWSPFTPCLSKSIPSVAGIYRFKDGNELVYLGESKNLRSRIQAHSKTSRLNQCEVSVATMPNSASHQLKEREVDMIGSFFRIYRCPPRYQYKPDK